MEPSARWRTQSIRHTGGPRRREHFGQLEFAMHACLYDSAGAAAVNTNCLLRHRPDARDDTTRPICRPLDAEVEEAIGPSLHDANAPALLEQQLLLAEHASVAHGQSREESWCHSADEQIVAPLWERGAHVERNASERRRRRIVKHRRLHSRRFRETIPDRPAVVLTPERHG